MRGRFSGSMITAAIAEVAVGTVSAGAVIPAKAQTPTATSAAATTPAAALKTPWGEPDLQGIWTDETDTPFQRSPKYANQEFFTEAQRAALDELRGSVRGRDERGERGSERDVSGAYNAVWGAFKRTGKRTSMIVDPPNGRIPPCCRRPRKSSPTIATFRFELMRATQTCKLKQPGCAGGFYDPTPSPRGADQPPRYNTRG